MENNNKGTNIFLGVIGVATLIVAIIGATFAFFGAQIEGGAGNLNVKAATLSLGYEDDYEGLKTDMIPAQYYIAEYAYKNTEHVGTYGECKDDNSNSICSVYEFTIGNPSATTAQTLYATAKVLTNGFSNLWFRIYDETGTEVVGPTKFPKSEGAKAEDLAIPLPALTQTLLATTNSQKADDADAFVASTPSTWALITTGTEDEKQYNKRTYTMLIWIEEIDSDQTDADSGATFTGSLYFTTANDTTGVTGVITAAMADAPASDVPTDNNPNLQQAGE